MTKIKFVLDDGTEMTKTETIHYLLQENRKLKDELNGIHDYIDGVLESYNLAFNEIQEEVDHLKSQKNETIPFTATGNDIVTFDTLDFAKVNDSWLD